MAPDKQHAHQLLDQLNTGQLAAIVHLLEVMTDPVARAIANAQLDDEPLTVEEIRALDEAQEWLKHNEGIPNEKVMAELGITQNDIASYKQAK